MKRALLLVATFAVAACESYGANNPRPRPLPIATVTQPEPAKTDCRIGPWMGSLNYSKNMPLYPTANPDGSWWLEFGNGGEPHYITCKVGSLTGKKQIRARIQLSGDPATIISGANCPATSASRITLYFEHKDVNWSKDGYRWWYKAGRSEALKPNMEIDLIAPLTGPGWGSVMYYTAEKNPDVFAQDKANTAWFGFTFGNCSGSGHGAVANGRVRVTVPYLRAE